MPRKEGRALLFRPTTHCNLCGIEYEAPSRWYACLKCGLLLAFGTRLQLRGVAPIGVAWGAWTCMQRRLFEDEREFERLEREAGQPAAAANSRGAS